MTLRIEAGLPLTDVEWHDSRTAWTDHDRVTPKELGQGWMLKGVRDRSRRFVGSEAIRRELLDGTSRWATTGIVVDWADWDRLYRDAGELPTKDEQALGWEQWLRDDADEQVGYVTSFCYSPVLQRHIGLARVRPELAAPGTGAAHGDDAAPQHAHGRREHRSAALLQPSAEDGQAMTETSHATPAAAPGRRTTPSWSAAATTA